MADEQSSSSQQSGQSQQCQQGQQTQQGQSSGQSQRPSTDTSTRQTLKENNQSGSENKRLNE